MDINKEINWCGGKWSAFRPPYSIMFDASCRQHDKLYNKWWNEIDRKIADVYFLEYLKRDVSYLKWYRRPYFYIWVYIYYIAVISLAISYPIGSKDVYIGLI